MFRKAAPGKIFEAYQGHCRVSRPGEGGDVCRRTDRERGGDCAFAKNR